MRKYGLFFVITGFALLFWAHALRADDPMGAIPVSERSVAGFEPMGLKLGKFMVYPSLDVETVTTSNVFQTSVDEKSDFITIFKPSLLMTGSMGAHDVSVSATGNAARYKTYDRQNYTDYDVVIKDRVALTRAVGVESGVFAKQSSVRRLDSLVGEIVGGDPITSEIKGVFAKMIFKPARFQWDIGVNYADIGYQNVRAIDTNNVLVQDDRDHTSLSMHAEVTYETQARLKPFFGVVYTRNDYDRRDYIAGAGYVGANQNRDRIDVLAGVKLAPLGKWRGAAKIGYGVEKSDDSALDNQGTGLVHIDLTYLYTPLTNFNIGFDRFFSDDTAAAQGVVETRLSASVIHELTRQWVLTAGTQWAKRDFQNGDEDKTLTSTISAEYALSRHFKLGGDIVHIDRESNRDRGDFTETKAMLHLKSSF